MALTGFLSYPLNPLQRLFRPDKSDVAIVFTFYNSYGLIKLDILTTDHDQESWLLGAFLTYLAFFCYSCTDRQREPMVNVYRELFATKGVDFKDYLPWLGDYIVNNTFTKAEQKAFNGLFGAWNPPPFMVFDESEGAAEKPDGKPLGRYTYQLTERDGSLISHLELSKGLDLYLFPFSVACLYWYVLNSVKSTGGKKLLNSLSIELLDSVYSKPSVTWQKNMPNELLHNAGRFTQSN